MDEKSFWDAFSTWKEAETAWDKKKRHFAALFPLKGLSSLPSMVGIVPETKKHLRWKGLKWLFQKDKGCTISRSILKHPLRYLSRYVRSCLSKRSFRREKDFFFYGLHSLDHFHSLMREENTLFVVGFAYCQKPFECPSGRFSAQCIASPENPVCSQCLIGKCFHALPREKTVCLVVPTVHYVGRKVFELQQLFPDSNILFLMTACEMMLEMFGDLGNMADIKGVGVRLDGRICNTFRAFQLAEEGIKPGLTLLLPETEQQVLSSIALWREQKKKEH